MRFWSLLFGKKEKKLGEDDGQAKYFKEDFETGEKKKTVKKTEQPIIEEKAPAAEEKKPAQEAEKKASKAESKAAKDEKKAPNAEKTKAAELADDSPEVKSSDTVKESRATQNGKFDIRKAKDGRFFFSLYASNGVVIAYSQIYSSISAVTTGINSVISNATKAEIEDTTLKKPVSLPCPKWELYIDKAGEYRFRLYATNGLCVCHSSHGYSTKSGCKGGIDSIRRFAAEARVDKSYLNKEKE